MRRMLAASLLLTACSGAELSTTGATVLVSHAEPPGCRSLGSVRDAEGGALRSFDANHDIVEARLRNEAARLGGNSLVVIDEQRGDTDSGAEHFNTGVPGLATPNSRCTNCVEMTARVFSCAMPASANPVVAEPGELVPAAPVAPPAPIWAPQPPASPVWGPPPPGAPPPVIIIIQSGPPLR